MNTAPSLEQRPRTRLDEVAELLLDALGDEEHVDGTDEQELEHEPLAAAGGRR